MKFKFFSPNADGIGFALKIADEGNDVVAFIGEDRAKKVGDGLVPKVDSIGELLEEVNNDTVFVFDSSGMGHIADYLRLRGGHVIGGNGIADRLELDRVFGSGAMQSAGIEIPKTWNFTDFDVAISFVGKEKSRFVFKPSKSLGETSLSYISYDAEDMIEYLSHTRDESVVKSPEFELQEFIEGVAISTECWFTGIDFAEGLWNHTLEKKQTLNDDLGASGGCSGNVLWPCGYCQICQELRKLKSFLIKHKYVGMLDLNAIVNGDGLFGLEFTPRFGYDASPTMFWELVDGDMSQVLSDVARNQYGDNTPKLIDRFAGGVRISIPPYPMEKFEAPLGIPIRGLRGREHVCLYDVQEVDGKLLSAGAWGIMMVVTGNGNNIEQSLRGPYAMAKKLRIPNKQYRTDLVKVLDSDMRMVRSYIQ